MHAKRIFRDINLLAAPSPTEVTRKSEYTPPPLNTTFVSNRGVGVYSEFVRNFRAYAHVPLLCVVYTESMQSTVLACVCTTVSGVSRDPLVDVQQVYNVLCCMCISYHRCIQLQHKRLALHTTNRSLHANGKV